MKKKPKNDRKKKVWEKSHLEGWNIVPPGVGVDEKVETKTATAAGKRGEAQSPDTGEIAWEYKRWGSSVESGHLKITCRMGFAANKNKGR